MWAIVARKDDMKYSLHSIDVLVSREYCTLVYT